MYLPVEKSVEKKTCIENLTWNEMEKKIELTKALLKLSSTRAGHTLVKDGAAPLLSTTANFTSLYGSYSRNLMAAL